MEAIIRTRGVSYSLPQIPPPDIIHLSKAELAFIQGSTDLFVDLPVLQSLDSLLQEQRLLVAIRDIKKLRFETLGDFFTVVTFTRPMDNWPRTVTLSISSFPPLEH